MFVTNWLCVCGKLTQGCRDGCIPIRIGQKSNAPILKLQSKIIVVMIFSHDMCCLRADVECGVLASPECRKKPCKPGFECIDRPTGYQCVCPKGKDCGHDCTGNKCHMSKSFHLMMGL